MAIKFRCGACGRKLAVKHEYAGWPTKCPACGAVINVPSRAAAGAGVAPDHPELMETPESYVAPSESTGEKTRPLWKDPVVVVGAAVPTLILVAFFAYLIWEHAEKEFEGRVVQLKMEADNLDREGQARPAFHKYEELLAMLRGKSFGASRYSLIVASATESRDRLYLVVKRELEREEMIRRAKTAAASRWSTTRVEDWMPAFLLFLVFAGKIAGVLATGLARDQGRGRRRR